MARSPKHKAWNIAEISVLVLSSLVVSAQTSARKESDVELRLEPSHVINGVPDTFSFVFVNVGDHEIRIPPVSPCVGRHSGTLRLKLDFLPVGPPADGAGGGCGGGVSHPPPILEQAKSWRMLQPGKSLTVRYKRSELFVFEQHSGAYDFSGEYDPPRLTADESATLEHAGIDFPREPLQTTHLRFNRSE
jgi:hypothetical protein